MEVGDQVKYNPGLQRSALPERRNKQGTVIRVWKYPTNIVRLNVRFGENDVDEGVSATEFMSWGDQ